MTCAACGYEAKVDFWHMAYPDPNSTEIFMYDPLTWNEYKTFVYACPKCGTVRIEEVDNESSN